MSPQKNCPPPLFIYRNNIGGVCRPSITQAVSWPSPPPLLWPGNNIINEKKKKRHSARYEGIPDATTMTNK